MRAGNPWIRLQAGRAKVGSEERTISIGTVLNCIFKEALAAALDRPQAP
jgi:hypothetical protein